MQYIRQTPHKTQQGRRQKSEIGTSPINMCVDAYSRWSNMGVTMCQDRLPEVKQDSLLVNPNCIGKIGDLD
jgi:hypothetical protein